MLMESYDENTSKKKRNRYFLTKSCNRKTQTKSCDKKKLIEK